MNQLKIDNYLLWADEQTSNLIDYIKSKFSNVLHINEWKANLEKSRKQDSKIAEQLEAAIAVDIKQICVDIPYKQGCGTPEEIISTGKANCEGKTLIASSVFEQIGINHKILYIVSPTRSPGHVLVLISGSNGNVFMFDPTNNELPLHFFNDKVPVVIPHVMADSSPIMPLILKDSDLKGAGNEAWGLVPTLAIKVYLLQPSVGRHSIILDHCAVKLLDLGKYSEALRIYQYLDRSGLITPLTLNNMATCYKKVGNYKKAIAVFQRLCQERSNEPAIWCRLALAYYEAGLTQKAEDTYLKAVNIKLGAFFPMKNYLGFLLNEGRNEEAAKLLSAFVKKYNPKTSEPYIDLLYCLMKTHRLRQAEKLIDQIDTFQFYISKNDREDIETARKVIDSAYK